MGGGVIQRYRLSTLDHIALEQQIKRLQQKVGPNKGKQNLLRVKSGKISRYKNQRRDMERINEAVDQISALTGKQFQQVSENYQKDQKETDIVRLIIPHCCTYLLPRFIIADFAEKANPLRYRSGSKLFILLVITQNADETGNDHCRFVDNTGNGQNVKIVDQQRC